MATPLFGLLLVFLASICWSSFDLLRKLLVARISPLALLLALTGAAVPPFAAWAWLAGSPVGPGYWTPALTSICLNVVANVALVYAISRSPLSLTVPLLSLIPVMTALVAVPILGERPSGLELLGIVLVVAGAIQLHLDAGGGVSAVGLVAALTREKGSFLMLLVALAWSLATPLDKLALRSAGAPFHGMVLNLGTGLGVATILAVRGRLGELSQIRRAPGLLPLAAVVGATALALQLLSYHWVWVSLVETIKRGIGNVSALVFGHLVLGEGVGWRKLVAVGLMAGGVALVLGT